MTRGRLRVYLGAAPGVGKTFAMLGEGRRRRERGTDVVIGLVETHDRPETAAAIGDLEIVPRRVVGYRGTEHSELDLDALLARAPEVALVDELAHTNVPGSRNAKRWQDVDELLDAGIDVITTVNIQHLESINDVAAAVTGVRQRETVPDTVVRAADTVDLVDMSPQALRRRMAHGNVYRPEQVDAALSRFFREGNLAALRELALLWLADRVDEGMERYRGQHGISEIWATRERIVVAVTGGPESASLLRRAARVASRGSGAEWMALVVAERDGLTGLSPDRLDELRTLTEELGGTWHAVVGEDAAGAILSFARAEDATLVIVGATRRSPLAIALRPGVGERVISGAGDIDVLVVTHALAGGAVRRRRDRRGLSRRRQLLGHVFAVLAPASTAWLLDRALAAHALSVDALVMMAVVVSAALLGGVLPAVVAAASSAILLNLMFTEPLGTLRVSDPQHVFTLVLFVLVGVAVASVVDRAARLAAQARTARAEADGLAVVAHGLLHAGADVDRLLAAAAELVGATGVALVETGTGGPVVRSSTGDPPESPDAADLAVEIDATRTLCVRGSSGGVADRRLLQAYAGGMRVALERQRAARAEAEHAELVEGERVRTALLAAVSHDLRSPLAAVKAAIASLRNEDIDWSEQDRHELLRSVADSADRLDALVVNLLDMSRISTGSVAAHLLDVDLTEVVTRAIRQLEGNERVQIDVEDVAVHADPALLERVLANLVENALTYTPPATPVVVDAAAADGVAVVRVVDRGPGVPDADRARLFAPFQRLGDVPAGAGVGLGLAVAQGLALAMGGTLGVEDTPGGGLTFLVELPTAQEVP
ncbi:ATP-binding protein [Pseudactinotalea suaedae]|uniref:ATP-binding protein n=1 Tax=Pseudactinotalea suaedae TaxID=1524924 RepID=UPI0012E0E9A4|nr:ATP-binding protein [Pseudactinotalea suaedae]